MSEFGRWSILNFTNFTIIYIDSTLHTGNGHEGLYTGDKNHKDAKIAADQRKEQERNRL